MKIRHLILLLTFFSFLSATAYFSHQMTSPKQLTGNHEETITKKEVSYFEDETVYAEEKACEKGTMQSPIQIESANVVRKQAPSIRFSYGEEQLGLVKQKHTLEAVSKSNLNFITIDNEQYKFESFHFHQPSEHQIEGQSHDMELHLVHKNEKGELAVVAVFIQSGKENDMIKEVWKFLKDETLKEKEYEAFNLLQFIPEEKTAYYYEGSLTTPPCTEGVRWIIFENPIEFSKDQIALFSKFYGNNNRPLQPANGREIIKISVK